MSGRRVRAWTAASGALIALLALGIWQWQAVARLAIIAAADGMTHARVSFGAMALSLSHATFENVRVVSTHDEPIANIERLSLGYNLRDLLPGGKRLFGLQSVVVDAPHIVVVRRPDGSLNVPSLPANQGKGGTPIVVRAEVHDGSIDLVNETNNAPASELRAYARNLQASADLDTTGRSSYNVAFAYGERLGDLHEVRGRGDIDLARGLADQHWSAAEIPIAAAVDFVANSPALRLDAGSIHAVDLRYYSFGKKGDALNGHLAGSAMLRGGRIVLNGLTVPVERVEGPLGIYDDGMLTPNLRASVSGVPLQIAGGLYDLHDPKLRLAVHGSGSIAQLRPALAQAKSLPLSGPVDFKLLVEGAAQDPVTWIDLRSSAIAYRSQTVTNSSVLAAIGGHAADIVDFRGDYRGIAVNAAGRIAFAKQPNAIRIVARAKTPRLAGLPIVADALAQGDTPKATAIAGILGDGRSGQKLNGIFEFDPTRNAAFAVANARGITVPQIPGALNATLFATESRGKLSGGALGDAGNSASFAAGVSGTASSPRIVGTLVVAGGRYRNFDLNGNAALAFKNSTLDVRNAAIALGPLFVGASGTIENVGPSGGTPRYDLAASLHSSDVGALVAAVRPESSLPVQGSVDANVRVSGSGTAPSFAGTMSAPEGSVNGLAFQDFSGAVSGDARALTIAGGRVTVGSTRLALDVSANAAGASSVGVSAPHADLADFNDFFDQGDTFAGTGGLALRAQTAGKQILASSGNLNFSGARFRRLDLGNVRADWRNAGSALATNFSFAGPAGAVSASGSVEPNSRYVNLRATAANVDLATWLPMLGYNVPITGKLDAQGTFVGSYPALASSVHATVVNGTAGRLPVQLFDVTASTNDGRGRIESAHVDLPSLTTTASGTFGFHADDPLDVTVHSTSDDVGAFLDRTLNKKYGVHGSLDSTLHVLGTRANPVLRDELVMQSLKRGDVVIPRAQGEIDVDRRSVALRNGELDLTRGRLLAAGNLPVEMNGSNIALRNAPISLTLRADDVELSNVVALLPKGTQASGRVDGSVAIGGALRAPTARGTLHLADGAFSGPMERTPIFGADATLAFEGERATLQSHAAIGGGVVNLQGDAALSQLTYTLRATADNARLDMPDYFTGNLNGSIALTRAAAQTPVVSGDLTVSHARVPLSAFLSRQSSGAGGSLPNVGFGDLRFAAGEDVRVQSGNVDIGGVGAVAFGGTLNAPTLTGSFHSTGGSLSFYRSFNVERSSVRFAGSLIPSVDAVATTYVADPPTAVRLHATGPVTDMNLSLASDPEYNREQILGLLVGAQQFGAVQGVSASRQGSSATAVGSQFALGRVNTLFTRTMLEPLSTSVANALGFTNVAITSDIQTGLGVNAVKAFGKNVSGIFGETFGYPKTESFGLEAHPSVGTSLRLQAYSASGPSLFGVQQPQPTGGNILVLNSHTVLPPASGTNGVDFTFVKRFP